MTAWLLRKQAGLGDPWDPEDGAPGAEPVAVGVYPDREAAAAVVGPIDGWSGPLPRKWRRVAGSLGAWEAWRAEGDGTWCRWTIAAQEVELDGDDVVLVPGVDANPVPPGIEAWLVLDRAEERGLATDPLVAAQAGDVEAWVTSALAHAWSLPPDDDGEDSRA